MFRQGGDFFDLLGGGRGADRLLGIGLHWLDLGDGRCRCAGAGRCAEQGAAVGRQAGVGDGRITGGAGIAAAGADISEQTVAFGS